MDQKAVEDFIAGLENVEREQNFGYEFFFVGDDHMLPFVTIAKTDNEYDKVSNLDRDGVFRINIGVSRETFDALVGHIDQDGLAYSVLDTFLPHPDYAKQNFICILNPAGDNAEKTKDLIREAHANAARRLARRATKRPTSG
jgi:hypothetical protein